MNVHTAKMLESSAEVLSYYVKYYDKRIKNSLRCIIVIGTSTCIDSEVQLAGGNNYSEGRVEICYNGVWGSVCANGWDQVDANLVCAQLGYYGQGGESLNCNYLL